MSGGSLISCPFHTHSHNVPLSDIKKAYAVDRIKDLKPVCPKCHAMFHNRKHPYSLPELQGSMKSSQKNQNP